MSAAWKFKWQSLGLVETNQWVAVSSMAKQFYFLVLLPRDRKSDLLCFAFFTEIQQLKGQRRCSTSGRVTIFKI